MNPNNRVLTQVMVEGLKSWAKPYILEQTLEPVVKVALTKPGECVLVFHDIDDIDHHNVRDSLTSQKVMNAFKQAQEATGMELEIVGVCTITTDQYKSSGIAVLNTSTENAIIMHISNQDFAQTFRVPFIVEDGNVVYGDTLTKMPIMNGGPVRWN